MVHLIYVTLFVYWWGAGCRACMRSNDPVATCSCDQVLYGHASRTWEVPKSRHSSDTALVDGPCHGRACASGDSYVYSSQSLPDDPRTRPSISNGHLGTVVHHDVVHVNGVYNGHLSESHRAVIPSTVNVNVTGLTVRQTLTRTYSVDAWKGLFVETLRGQRVDIEHRQFAHRTVGPLLVTQVEAQVRSCSQPQTITLDVNVPDWLNSPDISFSADMSALYFSRNGARPSYRVGQITQPETNTSGYTEVHVIYDVIPETLVIPRGVCHVVWTFLSSTHVTREAATRGYVRGKNMLYDGRLYTSHVTAWQSLWTRGRIDIHGDARLSKMTSSSLYYILSSLPMRIDPDWPYIGLSPNGLPWGGKNVDYLGHVFWDQETWMFPPVLSLHHNLASILLARRKRTAIQARQNARKNGYKGMQYPWEVAYTGVEVSPSNACAHQEIHINGDIILAVLQYIWATDDSTIDNDSTLGDIIIGVADFWISKITYNSGSGLYEIHDVMGPDEYHANINNSVYTNVLAKITLQAASQLCRLRGSGPRHDPYQHYADRVYVPLDTVRQYHPEYDGYTPGTEIKQADTIMLGYPLLYNITTAQRRNDLMIYENVTNPLGPAMTWCMHAIGWLELGDTQRAYDNLKKTFGNVANDFMVWTEIVGRMGAPNFITGQGGFLQAMLSGYIGLRIRQHHIDISCQLPSNVTQIAVFGLDYLGNSLDVICEEVTLAIEVTQRSTSASDLCLMSRDRRYPLHLQTPVQISRDRSLIAKQLYLRC